MKRSKWQLLYLTFVIFYATIVNAFIVKRSPSDKHIKTVANCYRAKRTDRQHWNTINGHTKTIYVCRTNHHTTSSKHLKNKTKYHNQTHSRSVIHSHSKGHSKHYNEKKHTTVRHHHTKKTKSTSRHRGNTGANQSKKPKKGSKIHRTTTKKHKKTISRHTKHSTTVHHSKKKNHTKSTHTIIKSHKTGETTSLTTPNVTSIHVTPGWITISLEGFEPALPTSTNPATVFTTTGLDSHPTASTNTQAYIPTQHTTGLSSVTTTTTKSQSTTVVTPNNPNSKDNNKDSSNNGDSDDDDSSTDNNDDGDDNQIASFSNEDGSSSEDNTLTTMGTTINPEGPAPTNIPNTQITAQKNSDGETVEATHQNKIIGISVGAVVGCVAAAGLAGMFIYRRRQDQETEEVPDEVNTRYRTQSFMAVVAGAVAKLPKRSDSSSSSGSRGVMSTLKRAATSMSRSLSRSGSRSSQQNYGIAVSGPMPDLAHADDRNYHTHAY